MVEVLEHFAYGPFMVLYNFNGQPCLTSFTARLDMPLKPFFQGCCLVFAHTCLRGRASFLSFDLAASVLVNIDVKMN